MCPVLVPPDVMILSLNFILALYGSPVFEVPGVLSPSHAESGHFRLVLYCLRRDRLPYERHCPDSRRSSGLFPS